MLVGGYRCGKQGCVLGCHIIAFFSLVFIGNIRVGLSYYCLSYVGYLLIYVGAEGEL